jgi:hypothetical protein
MSKLVSSRAKKSFVLSRHFTSLMACDVLKCITVSVFLHAQSSHLPLTTPICCKFQFGSRQKLIAIVKVFIIVRRRFTQCGNVSNLLLLSLLDVQFGSEIKRKSRIDLKWE